MKILDLTRGTGSVITCLRIFGKSLSSSSKVLSLDWRGGMAVESVCSSCKGPDSVPSTHIMAHECLTSVPEDLMLIRCLLHLISSSSGLSELL